MRRILGKEFFDRPTLLVARDLLGKFLVRKIGKREVALMIVETEAYHGFKDLASKARRGKTKGNAPMYGRPGTLYVYFTYGMHWMLNIVTEKEEYPAAVLIRGLSFGKPPRSGEMNGSPTPARGGLPARKKLAAPPLNGPAKLTKYLKIDKKLNGRPLGRETGLFVEDRGVRVKKSEIKKGPRVGIDYAGPYVHKPWRFMLQIKRS